MTADKLIAHPEPIDRQASKMFWKAPWWAQYPEPAKRAILEVKNDVSWEAFVNYINPPPNKGRPEGNKLKDRRGETVQDKLGFVAKIIGYSRSCPPGEVQVRLRARSKPIWFRGDGWNDKQLNKDTYGAGAIWWAVVDGFVTEVWQGPRRSYWRVYKPKQDHES
jgi:hypothetical protein